MSHPPSRAMCTGTRCMQAGRYRLGVQRYDFDAGLAPYPLHSHGQWLALSCHISEVRPPARECDLHMSILLYSTTCRYASDMGSWTHAHVAAPASRGADTQAHDHEWACPACTRARRLTVVQAHTLHHPFIQASHPQVAALPDAPCDAGLAGEARATVGLFGPFGRGTGPQPRQARHRCGAQAPAAARHRSRGLSGV